MRRSGGRKGMYGVALCEFRVAGQMLQATKRATRKPQPATLNFKL